MAVTIKDIARALSLSPAAVSFALNDSPNVSRETIRRVKETARRMGYVRNQYARGLVRGRSGAIALVVPDIENVFFASLVKHITSATTGYDVTISITNESIETEWHTISAHIQQHAEAILLAPVNRPIADADYIKYLNDCPVPIVFTTASHPDVRRPCVMSDLEAGMRDLAQHVIQKGVGRIALLTGPKGVQTLDLREKGFFDALHSLNCAGEVWRVNEVTYQNAIERVAAAADLPEAVICVNDMMAIGALNALNARGIAVPEDIIVAGFDDSIFAEVSPVPLTTVHQDVALIARRSVEIAVSQIEQKDGHADEIIPCSLVPRDSTNRPLP
jgi:LacI family transcriptional regulator